MAKGGFIIFPNDKEGSMLLSQCFTISYVGKDITLSNAREITMTESVKHTTIILK
mgnify:CR=1 FL=1